MARYRENLFWRGIWGDRPQQACLRRQTWFSDVEKRVMPQLHGSKGIQAACCSLMRTLGMVTSGHFIVMSSALEWFFPLRPRSSSAKEKRLSAWIWFTRSMNSDRVVAFGTYASLRIRCSSLRWASELRMSDMSEILVGASLSCWTMLFSLCFVFLRNWLTSVSMTGCFPFSSSYWTGSRKVNGSRLRVGCGGWTAW